MCLVVILHPWYAPHSFPLNAPAGYKYNHPKWPISTDLRLKLSGLRRFILALFRRMWRPRTSWVAPMQFNSWTERGNLTGIRIRPFWLVSYSLPSCEMMMEFGSEKLQTHFCTSHARAREEDTPAFSDERLKDAATQARVEPNSPSPHSNEGGTHSALNMCPPHPPKSMAFFRLALADGVERMV